MMSIEVIKSAGSAADYYLTDDSGSMVVDSEWFGSGAQSQGLQGAVDKATLTAVLEGQVGGQQLGRKLDGKHKPGWDLTFSAPKSVSLLALVSGDTRLIEAHQAAVRQAMTAVEAEQIVTRCPKDGVMQTVPTGQLTAALCTHTTNRDLEPHLHTHAVVANATQGEDGKWRSIESRPMFETIKHTGQIYRNALALEVKALGYELAVDHRQGFFEIKGVPRAAIERFSSRDKAIKQAIAEQDLKTARAIKYQAVLKTRDGKTAVDRTALVQDWQAQLGFAGQALVEQSQAQKPVQSLPPLPDLVLSDVRICYKTLANKEAVFSRQALSEQVMRWGLGRSSHGDVQRAIDALVTKEELVPSLLMVNKKEEPALTTPEALKRESQLLKQLNQGKDCMAAVASLDAVRAGIEQSSKTLTEGQRQAVALIGTSRDRLFGVQGFAGTGKTTMLETAKTLVEQGGYRLRGLAPTHSAVRTLQQDTGIASATLASFLNEVDQGQAEIGQNEVWVVDEASLVSTQTLTQLMSAAQQSDSRVCLVGDRAQLGSVEWGKPFCQLIQRGMAYAEMKDIRRQKDARLLAAVKSAIAFDPARTLSLIRDKGDVQAIGDTQQRQARLVDDYLALSTEQREETRVIVPDNDSRHAVMASIRAGLVRQGEVNPQGRHVDILIRSGLDQEETRDARFYQPGQIVEFERPYRQLGPGVEKGDCFHVVSVDALAGEVRLAPYGGHLNESPDPRQAFVFQPAAIRNRHNVISVYQRQQKTFAPGDRIVWNKTRKDLGFKTGQQGQVLAVNDRALRVQFQEGVRELDTRTMKHFDYDYAMTVHSAQGQNVDRVLAMVESWRRNLINQKSFYVALSRGRYSARIYTDNEQKLIEGIQNRSGEKTSALDSVSEDLARKHRYNIKDELQEAKEQKEKAEQQRKQEVSQRNRGSWLRLKPVGKSSRIQSLAALEPKTKSKGKDFDLDLSL